MRSIFASFAIVAILSMFLIQTVSASDPPVYDQTATVSAVKTESPPFVAIQRFNVPAKANIEMSRDIAAIDNYIANTPATGYSGEYIPPDQPYTGAGPEIVMRN